MKCDINRQATCTQFTRPLLDSYTNRAKNRLQDGEMIYLTDEETYLVWMNKEWVSLPKKVEGQNQGFSMTTYDLNKSLIAQMPVLEDLTEACAVIDRYADDNENFLLLCKDISYYTIFEKTGGTFVHFDTLGEAVLTCASDIGKIITVDFMEETNTIEIWVRTPEDDNLCMCFFECSGFMVYYARN